MRTLVDIPERDLEALDRLRRGRGTSRANLIRQAIEAYLARHAEVAGDEGFGLWRGRALDGLKYQRKLRSEW